MTIPLRLSLEKEKGGQGSAEASVPAEIAMRGDDIESLSLNA
jgi:hypothetical protein